MIGPAIGRLASYDSRWSTGVEADNDMCAVASSGVELYISAQ